MFLVISSLGLVIYCFNSNVNHGLFTLMLPFSPLFSGIQVRLEVMGGKAKNATFISGNEAGKISKEVARVEKRRIVKSTLCNERSSRSHCMVSFRTSLWPIFENLISQSHL